MQLLTLSAFGLAGLMAVLFGARYIFLRAFMPYHATVSGRQWPSLEPRLQVVILGMLKVAGGGLVGCGLAVLWLLLPVQRGESWAVCATVTVLLAVTGPILYVAMWLRNVSPGAKTPVAPTLMAMALALVGAVAFVVSRT